MPNTTRHNPYVSLASIDHISIQNMTWIYAYYNTCAKILEPYHKLNLNFPGVIFFPTSSEISTNRNISITQILVYREEDANISSASC